MTTRSLLLASIAYVSLGLVACGLLATGNATIGSAENEHVVVAMPIPNTEAKQDRLTVAKTVANAIATAERWQTPALADATITGSTGQPKGVLAFAVEPPPSRVTSPIPFSAPSAQAPIRPPAAQPKKPTSPLSDEQIAGLHERMQLSPSQQAYWPAIEVALRKIGKHLHRTGPSGAPPAIDPDSPEVQELKSAAMPLLWSLTEDQKREVRTMARLIGLTAVASAI